MKRYMIALAALGFVSSVAHANVSGTGPTRAKALQSLVANSGNVRVADMKFKTLSAGHDTWNAKVWTSHIPSSPTDAGGKVVRSGSAWKATFSN